jgi:hypothetical protein
MNINHDNQYFSIENIKKISQFWVDNSNYFKCPLRLYIEQGFRELWMSSYTLIRCDAFCGLIFGDIKNCPCIIYKYDGVIKILKQKGLIKS